MSLFALLLPSASQAQEPTFLDLLVRMATKPKVQTQTPAPPAAPAAAAAAVTPGPSKPLGLTVSGIALGMSPTDVSKAAVAAGYRLTSSSEGMAWSDVVEQQLANESRGTHKASKGGGVSSQFFNKGIAEQIVVYYRPEPSGSKSVSVNYSIQSGAISEEVFGAAIKERYGPPSRAGSWETIYCSVGESVCSIGISDNPRLSHLRSHSANAGTRTITLKIGEDDKARYESSIRAEMDRISPRTSKPSF